MTGNLKLQQRAEHKNPTHMKTKLESHVEKPDPQRLADHQLIITPLSHQEKNQAAKKHKENSVAYQ